VDGVCGGVVIAMMDGGMGCGWVESEVGGEESVGESKEGEGVMWEECGKGRGSEGKGLAVD